MSIADLHKSGAVAYTFFAALTRRRLDLPSPVPGGGRAPYGAGAGWRSVTRRGLAFSPPSPRPPSRREGGDYKFISPGAAAPGTPASNRLRHLQFPPCRCLAGSWFLQHGFPLPRRVPVPRQSPKNQFPTSIASAARVQPRGCKGRSPLHKITYSHPLPAGKGAGGIGAEKKSKGRVSRRPKPTRPPLGTADARRTDNAGASPPIEFSTAAGRTSAARVQPRGCKGRSPLHKKTKNLPLPAGKGGGGLSFPSGEGGQEIKPKAGLAGGKAGKPPAGYR